MNNYIQTSSEDGYKSGASTVLRPRFLCRRLRRLENLSLADLPLGHSALETPSSSSILSRRGKGIWCPEETAPLCRENARLCRTLEHTDDREGSWGRSRSTGTVVGAELASPSFRLGFATPSRATFQAFSRPICSLTFFNFWLMFGKL